MSASARDDRRISSMDLGESLVPATPTILIGVPAYNNAVTLVACLDSLVNQTYRNIQIVISDDQSTDETRAIGMKYAEAHPQVRYFLQPKNLKYQNFGELLRSATTDYFMWAAGDDVWKPDFVERCVAALEADSDAVLAVTDVEFVDAASGRRWLARGVQPLSGSWVQRFSEYFADPSDNSRMYGVMRTSLARQCFPAESFHAYDWAFSAATTKFGAHLHLPGVGLVRDKTPSSRYASLARQDAMNKIDYLFPVWRMSWWLLRQQFVPSNSHAWWQLVQINLNKHREIIEAAHPYAYRPQKLLAAMARRLLR